MSENKYWFSYKSTGKGIRIPKSKEGKVFTLLYLIFGLAAVIFTIPKSQNPSFSHYAPLLIVAVILIVTYMVVTTFKAEPSPQKK